MDKPKKKRPWIRDKVIESALRRAYGRSPAVAACLESGKEEYFVTAKNGNKLRRVRYKCVLCGYRGRKRTKKKVEGIAVDHIEPVADPVDGNLLPDGSKNWNKHIARLFVDEIGIQRLCKQCHEAKSKLENSLRLKYKK